ncbi:LTA synthase family protein [Prolixibacter sp. NT017]|uniref:LTA synthase family protein n=1 Tax=Prolixibacter sp. NT017 TaxID=2652390 RepID=UPI001279AE3B|nr:alkaline phosphatase family protein [Prolixibacter sp. NT017]GET26642.1 sulfatase [Prolixibacter sp. NT017]
MRERLTAFLRLFIFWFSYFISARIFFTVYEVSLTRKYAFSEILLAFLHGSRLDLSATGYFLMLNGLILTLSIIGGANVFRKIILGINRFFIALFALVIVGDAEIYRNWGSHLDSTPLMYLNTPKEMLASTSAGRWVLLFALIFSFAGLWLYLFKKFVSPKVNFSNAVRYTYALPMLLLTGAMILPVRGSLGIAPINTGSVYFSKDLYPNHVAVNSVWNFLYSLKKLRKMDPPYRFMPNEKADSLFHNLYAHQGSTKHLLKTEHPNVVLILLESFTAKMIEPLGGVPGITPNLNRWCHNGILFDHIYASGDRSAKGIVAVVSGFPAQPTASIIKLPQKTQLLPFISREMKTVGYNCSYYYGGNVDFANMRSYITLAGFDTIVSKKDFPEKDCNSKWGVHDHIMFKRLYDDISKSKGPFFKMLFTLSSHEPFDVPMKTVIKGNDEASKFMNSAYYTDKCLGAFLDSARKSSWWNNTLIVMVADHGHPQPGNSLPTDPLKYHIPLLFTGGALAVTDTVVHTYGSQTDIAATLLHQLSLNANQFRYSKDLLADSTKSFSFFAFNNGFGFLSDSATRVFDNTAKEYVTLKDSTKENDAFGKAYLQVMWNDFLNK